MWDAWGGGGVWGGFFFQAEDGIRDLVRSRGLGDVYKRQTGNIQPHALMRAKRLINQMIGGCAGDCG